MNSLAAFARDRLTEDVHFCVDQLATNETPENSPIAPDRVLQHLRIQLKIVEAYASCARHPRLMLDTALHVEMSTLRNVVGEIARLYHEHPDYLKW